MRIWHISDSHGFHKGYVVPENIDLVICSGDVSNYRETFLNLPECMNFFEWFQELPIKHKVFVAGNHDTSFERNHMTGADLAARGITYLEDNYTHIREFKIWGSPRTPTFGQGWAFNVDRGKIERYWNNIDIDTDVLITHGPPYGILDISEDRARNLESCGCKSLMRRVREMNQLKLMCFGHIHDYKEIKNQGVLYREGKYFSNGAGVYDGRFDKGLINNGNIIEL
jgi:Icc-related predicted phosphoesterase